MEVARAVAMLCSAGVGVWKVVVWVDAALVLVLVLVVRRLKSTGRALRCKVREGVGVVVILVVIVTTVSSKIVDAAS